MTISIAFLFSIDFFYIYIYCRKFNAEFNKLIKTVGHRDRFFPKNDGEHTHLCQQFWLLFGYFDIVTYQVLKL